MEWGFVDVFRMHKPEEKAFTFWDYRIPNAVKRNLGWRIDHICATRCLAEVSETAWIDVEPRLLQKPSDHTFIVAKFSFKFYPFFFSNVLMKSVRTSIAARGVAL